MTKIEMGKNYTFRGMPARIIATDRKGPHPILALVLEEDGTEFVFSFLENGRYDIGLSEYLIEARPRIKRTVWINVYGDVCDIYSSKEKADAASALDRISCVKVEIDCEEGEGL
jgi:hypothetical protein